LTTKACELIQQWLPIISFFLDYFKIAKGLGGPHNDFSVCHLTTVIHCAMRANDYNKEAGTALNLMHKYLRTSVLLVYFN
jgi:hypothetical protein